MKDVLQQVVLLKNVLRTASVIVVCLKVRPVIIGLVVLLILLFRLEVVNSHAPVVRQPCVKQALGAAEDLVRLILA